MHQFDTSIKSIMDSEKEYNLSHNEKSIFLSDWDVPDSMVSTVPFLNNYAYNDFNNLINKYYYWSDNQNYKYIVSDFYYNTYGEHLSSKNFTIGNNGTSSITLTLYALKEMGIKRILVFTPIYFGVLNLLEMLGYQIYRFDLKLSSDLNTNFSQLDEMIKKYRIQTLFITDPVFGSGYEYDLLFYEEIIRFSRKYDLQTIIDYIYGGMNWCESNYIINKKMEYFIKNCDIFITIESISKRLFMNGIKIAIIYANEKVIKKVQRLSIYVVGSMCFLQLELIKKLYSMEFCKDINLVAHKNIENAKNTYAKISAFLLDYPIFKSKCNSSYFVLMGIKKESSESDIDFSIELLNKTGVLTIPHSRYLLEEDSKYIFRVNLLINNNILWEGINRIISLV